jgi:hypothetical protein
VLLGQPPPLVRVALLEGKTLPVRAVRQDHRIFAVLRRTVNVGPQYEAVIHRDWNIPVNHHSIPEFTLLPHLCSFMAVC